MKIRNIQIGQRSAQVSSIFFHKLYSLFKILGGGLELSGTLETRAIYKDEGQQMVGGFLNDEKSTGTMQDLNVNTTDGYYKTFKDPEVKRILTQSGYSQDTIGITETEFSNIINFENLFADNQEIIEFTEFEDSTIVELGGYQTKDFYNDTNLKKIKFPQTLKKINTNIANNTTEVSQIITPGYTNFYWQYQHGFAGCSQLELNAETDLINLEDIGVSCFQGCTKLTGKLNLPNLKSLGYGAFNGSGITEIVGWPGNLKLYIPGYGGSNIGDMGIFRGCLNLKKVELGDNVTQITGGMFRECPELEEINLPEGLQSIGVWSFTEDRKLKITEIPSTVTTISTGAFFRCGIVGELNMKCDNLTNIGESVFRENPLQSVILPNNLTFIPNEMFCQCESLKDITWPGRPSITIDPDTEEEIIVPSPYKVTQIGVRAFFNCKSLVNPKIPDTITVIKEGGFEGCSNMILTKLPTSLQTLDRNAFYGCKQLRDLELPEGFLSFNGNNAFGECTNLNIKKLPDSFIGTTIPSGTFGLDPNIELEELPDHITKIGHGAFNQCFKLKLSKLPQSLQYIEGWAFQCCRECTFLDFPENVNHIGSGNNWAFSYFRQMYFRLHSKTVPVLENFSNFSFSAPLFFVKDELLQEYAVAPNWSTLYNYGSIRPLSEEQDFCHTPGYKIIYSTLTNVQKGNVQGDFVYCEHAFRRPSAATSAMLLLSSDVTNNPYKSIGLTHMPLPIGTTYLKADINSDYQIYITNFNLDLTYYTSAINVTNRSTTIQRPSEQLWITIEIRRVDGKPVYGNLQSVDDLELQLSTENYTFDSNTNSWI